ncbi:bifunctional diguanylate cyclase/phosphodiesterase [Hoeflea sp. TYP-13]|uniref:bifunctional diguanylate cyclase/phosphodiesterase n=1 Tax=Hoeflea sp. TYP-13 TaxID=3230023 RepID=UPI0034C69EE3
MTMKVKSNIRRAPSGRYGPKCGANPFVPISFLILFFQLSVFNFGVSSAEEIPFPELGLTSSEQSWLVDHPEIRLAVDVSWPPFEFVDGSGNYRGMAAEYVRLVEKRLGIRVNVDIERSWPEMMEAVKNRELDAFSLIAKTPERENFVSFTNPYLSFPMVIVTLDDEQAVDDMEILKDKTVAVVRSYASHEILAKNHPDMHLLLENTARAGLEAVSGGRAFAFVGNLAVVSQVIHDEGITNLKISGQTPYRFELGMAVRKDWPELVSILQKALDSISVEERDTIYNHWVHVRYQEEIDYRIVLAVIAVGLVILLFILGWNRLLQKEIQRRHKVEAALDQKRRRLQDIIWGTDVGTWEWNVQSNHSKFNDRSVEIVGYTLEELEPIDMRTWFGFVHPDDLEVCNDLIERNFSCELEHLNCEVRLRHKNGDWLWVRVRGKVVEWSANKKPLRMSGTLYDITEQKQNEASLQLAASVFTSALEGIAITDPSGNIIDANEAFTQITGYARCEVLDQNILDHSSNRNDPAFAKSLWQQLEQTGKWTGEVWKRRKDGDEYVEMLTVSAVCNDKNEVCHYVALCSDITETKNHQRQLEHLAHFDALTGLPNRVLLANRLCKLMNRAQRRGQNLAVAYIDLDGFKAVNDTHGHEAGDNLLITISDRMRKALRKSDTLARLGGDEFVAVLTDLRSVDAARPILDRLLGAATISLDESGLSLSVSASIGVTFFPQPEIVEADQLLRQADQAMYHVKLTGKNRHDVFDDEANRAIKGRHEELAEVSRAIEKEEFTLYYQPKVNMRTGAIVGAEALIRWKHPERGLLLPGAFQWALDDHPQSIALGEWVVDSALSQIETWQSAGLDIPISVNIGPRQLRQGDFVSRLRAILSTHPNVDPKCLELEILETDKLENASQVTKNMVACQKMGVGFALDDFGTGYSSLLHLKRLPVTSLKIDRAFVLDMLEDPEDFAIVQGIMGLATAFQIPVIAEGVETPAHGQMLLWLGCELAQGYAIARPMPAEEFPNWASTWHPDPDWWNVKKETIKTAAVLAEVKLSKAS